VNVESCLMPNALLQRIAESIQEKLPNVLAVYVFGSVAKGEANAESDLDLAVLADCDTLPVMHVWELAQTLAKGAGMDVDLIDLRAASAVMRIQVIAEGKRLICTDEDACAVFEDLVFSDYARLNEEREGILADIQQRGSIYG